MRIAALDVGSNSFHLIVADIGTGGHISVLDRAKEMVRLGDSTLHQGVIPPEVFRRGLDALRALRRIADRHNVDALIAVALGLPALLLYARRKHVNIDADVARSRPPDGLP